MAQSSNAPAALDFQPGLPLIGQIFSVGADITLTYPRGPDLLFSEDHGVTWASSAVSPGSPSKGDFIIADIYKDGEKVMHAEKIWDGRQWQAIEERELTMVIPIVFNTLFTMNEADMLTQIGLTPAWFLEYTLCQWCRLDTQIVNGLRDEAYESFVDDIHQHLTEHIKGPASINWEGKFPFFADALFELMVRMYRTFKPFLGRVPEGDEHFTLLAANVKHVGHDTITVLLAFDNRYGGFYYPEESAKSPLLLEHDSMKVF